MTELADMRNHKASVLRNIRVAERVWKDKGRAELLRAAYWMLLSIRLPRK